MNQMNWIVVNNFINIDCGNCINTGGINTSYINVLDMHGKLVIYTYRMLQ